MSRTLAHLRQLIGDPLLVQKGRSLRLTDHAQALRPRVQAALLSVQQAFRAPTRFDPSQGTFEVRVAASDYAHTALLMPWLKSVRLLAPGLQLRMLPLAPHSVAALAAGELDFAIGPPVQQAELGLERFVARPVWMDRFVCAMRAGHACTHGRFDLRRFLSLVHVQVECGDMPVSSETACAKLGYQRNVTAVVPSFLQALALVRDSDWVAMLPERLLLSQGAGFEARELPFDVGGIGLYLAWHPSSHDNARHRWLVDNLLGYAAERVTGSTPPRSVRAART